MATNAAIRRGLLGALLALLGACVGAAQNFEMTDAQLNSWLTNGRGSPLETLEAQLEGRLAWVDEACDLTEPQRQKLRLAGEGDIARFSDDYAALRDEVVGKTYDQNKINEVYQQVRPLAEKVQNGVLDDGSLFQKVRAVAFNGEQKAAFQRAHAEQIRAQYEAKLKLFVASLDTVAPMLAEQREALLGLLRETTRPPQRWSGSAGSNYDWYYVLHHVGRVPRERVAKVLDEAQLRCFDEAVKQARNYGQMLIQQGMVPMEEDPAPAAPAPQPREGET